MEQDRGAVIDIQWCMYTERQTEGRYHLRGYAVDMCDKTSYNVENINLFVYIFTVRQNAF